MLPLLILAGHGRDISSFLDVICALELIHTYSLIHDDLPSMDDDDFRRGKPSLHRAYEESTAILTGDFLLTYSFELIAKSRHLDATLKAELIYSLSHFGGGKGLIGGQIEDMAQEASSYHDLEIMYAKKTAALFSCALDFGALLCSDLSRRMALQNLGFHMGILYQHLDDIQDQDSHFSLISPLERKARCNFHFEQMKEICLSLPNEYESLKTYVFNHLFPDLE